MAVDLDHRFGNDIAFTGNGDLATVSGPTYTTQRIIRRLCTNLQAYVWQATYGASLPAKVGDTINQDTLSGIVQSQMTLEAAVDQSKPITVALVTNNLDTVVISVNYTDADTGEIETAVVPLS